MAPNFSFSRLIQLIRKQWIENNRLYLFSTLALLGLLGLGFIIWLVASNDKFDETNIYVIFTLCIYIAGTIFAGMSFGMLGEKRKGVYWLGFPASHLEKLICIIFYNVIVFSVVYYLCFMLVKTLAVAYVLNLVAADPAKYQFRHMDWNSGFGSAYAYFIYGFYSVQAFYLLGAVYFSRFSYLLTTGIGAALFFIFMWFCISLMSGKLPAGYGWGGFSVMKYNNYVPGPDTINKYQLPGLYTDSISFLLKFIWAPVFWVVAWYRLKEKQI